MLEEKVTRAEASEEFIERLDALERFKRIFLVPSDKAFLAVKALEQYDQLLEGVKQRRPELPSYPTPMEIGKVIECMVQGSAAFLQHAQATASTVNRCTLGMLMMHPCVIDPVNSPTSVDAKKAAFEYSQGLHSHMIKLNWERILDTYSEHKANSESDPLRRTLNWMLSTQERLAVDVATGASFSFPSVSRMNMFEGKPMDIRDLSEYAELIGLETYTGAAEDAESLRSYHDMIRDEEVSRVSALRMAAFTDPRPLVPHAIGESLMDAHELVKRFENEYSLHVIDNERAVALAYVLRISTVPNDANPPLGEIIDSAISTLNQLIPQQTKSMEESERLHMPQFIRDQEVRGIAENTHVLRCLKLNRSWLAAHIGEHFIGQVEHDPREL